MRVLVFDTETTGLPKSKYVNPTTLHEWPYIVQFSYVVYDFSENEIVESKDWIIKMQKNITIPEESIKFHNITNEMSAKSGVNIHDAIHEFFYSLKGIDVLVGHNVEFDINMLKVELLRIVNDDTVMFTKEQLRMYKDYLYRLTNFKTIVCTLKDSIELCNITAVNKSGKTYLKYPKLVELHEKLFNKSPSNLHNSFNDILVTLRCFIKLKYDIDLNDTCPSFKKQSHLIGLN